MPSHAVGIVRRMFQQCPVCRSYNTERIVRLYEVYFRCRSCSHVFRA